MNDHKRPVSLEDLLRFKRAERPPAEFWSEFDRQLRAKQLAALVARKPWWHGFGQALSHVGRYRLPLGATAALAITFIALRDDSSVPVAPVAHAPAPTLKARVETAPVETQVAGPRVNLAELSVAATPLVSRAEGDELLPEASSIRSSETLTAAAERTVTVPETLNAFEAVNGSGADPEPVTPSARFIAANFAAAQDSIGTGLLAEPHGFESRAMPARAVTIDPLQTMTPPGEARRSVRFLTAMASTTFDDTSVRTERVANRISPDELYDQVRRIGTRRGGFNVKF